MSFLDRLLAFCRAHRYGVIFAVLGLVVTILIFTINFWRTLLLVLIVGLCALVGCLLDKGGMEAVRAFFDRFLPKR